MMLARDIVNTLHKSIMSSPPNTPVSVWHVLESNTDNNMRHAYLSANIYISVIRYIHYRDLQRSGVLHIYVAEPLKYDHLK